MDHMSVSLKSIEPEDKTVEVPEYLAYYNDMNTPSRQQFIEQVESQVLDALDTLVQQYGCYNSGWIDADLACLLPGIRTHANKLFDRLKNNLEKTVACS